MNRRQAVFDVTTCTLVQALPHGLAEQIADWQTNADAAKVQGQAMHLNQCGYLPGVDSFPQGKLD